MRMVCELCEGYGRTISYDGDNTCRECLGTGLVPDYNDTGGA